jgi:G:T/U-mismatch repair DNA glycosylase
MVISCEIEGSADASVKNAVTADLNQVFQYANIEKILLNGTLSYDLFLKSYESLTIPYQKMPSTSPANAAWSFERLVEAWNVIK